jgi:hypothetical protein
MSKIGFLDIVRETIALSQMLSVSSRHLGLLMGSDSADSYGYSIQATNNLQERLADPAACTSDEVISVVLAFACYAVRLDLLPCQYLIGSLEYVQGPRSPEYPHEWP